MLRVFIQNSFSNQCTLYFSRKASKIVRSKTMQVCFYYINCQKKKSTCTFFSIQDLKLLILFSILTTRSSFLSASGSASVWHFFCLTGLQKPNIYFNSKITYCFTGLIFCRLLKLHIYKLFS